ncbi:MAG: ammonium transporter [Verrucomicrobiia bacterium]
MGISSTFCTTTVRTLYLLLLLTPLTPFLTHPTHAQNRDRVATVEEDIQKINRDLLALQREVLGLQREIVQSGITEQTRKDLEKLRDIDLLKANLEKLQLTVETGLKSAEGGLTAAQAAALAKVSDIDTLLEEIESLKKTIAGLEPAPKTATDSAPAVSDDKLTTLENSLYDTTVGTTYVWVLVAGFLVMFMQAGFALVETGFTRAKNAAHTMTMNFMDYAVGLLAYWAFGFAIMFGNAGDSESLGFEGGLTSALGFTLGETTYTLFGLSGWFLSGEQIMQGGIFTLFLFQAVFASTANTIPTGTLAERWKVGSFAIHSIIVAGFLYPIYGHWVWGGGWLSELGYYDFAGSSVVHMAGGVLALVGAWVVGPRAGKFNPDGSSNPIPGHNIPMAILGTFILAFGWFGFNTGSTINGNDAQLGIIAANTALAAAAGAVVAFFASKFRFGKPDPSFACNGMLGGLVGITAPCAFVDAWAAVTIGAIAGALVVYSAVFVEETLKLDDPVGAISVHGTCGAWGTIALGVFANGTYGDVSGLIHNNPAQVGIQVLGVVICFIFFFVGGYLMFKFTDLIVGNAAPEADQIEGLDLAELGVEAYPPDLTNLKR